MNIISNKYIYIDFIYFFIMKKEKKRKQKKNNNIIIKKIKLLIFTILFPFYEYIYKNVLLELYKFPYIYPKRNRCHIIIINTNIKIRENN